MGLNLGTQIDANGENMEDRDRERSVEFKQNSCEIKLDEGHIPGSTLSKPPEQCNKAVLKRWLACRGAKVGGNRDELIKRIKNYIDNGLDKDIIDPDNGINIARKRLELELAEEIDPEVSEKFPTEGFLFGISELPKISYSHIWKYLIEDVELRKQLSTEKPIVKGYNFFKSGHVLQIWSKKDLNVHYVRSKVLPSMTKKKIYTVNIIIKASGHISKAMCGCPAGVDGRCNHLAATLFAIEDKFQDDSQGDSNNSSKDNELPCTSKPCSWNVSSRKRKLENCAIQSIHFEKHEYGKKAKHMPRMSFDVRAPHEQTFNINSQKIFYTKVKKVEMLTGKRMALSFILPHDLPVDKESSEVVPSSNNLDTDQHLWQLIPPEESGPMSLHDIALRAIKVKQCLYESAKKRTGIELKTRDQHNSLLWYNVRKPRITASKAKRCLIKESTSPTKVIEEVLMYKQSIQTSKMKEGIEMEPKIIEEFEKESGKVVTKCGFFVSESHPFLGASPDGITDSGELIEVKKVTSKDYESKEETLCRLGIYKKNADSIILNENHRYYHQIQQQLFCTKHELCHFLVSNGNWLHIELVLFNRAFWDHVLPNLKEFYFKNILPELAYPRVLFKQPRWYKSVNFPRLSE